MPGQEKAFSVMAWHMAIVQVKNILFYYIMYFILLLQTGVNNGVIMVVK